MKADDFGDFVECTPMQSVVCVGSGFYQALGWGIHDVQVTDLFRTPEEAAHDVEAQGLTPVCRKPPEILEDIPVGTQLNLLTFEFPTNRWATLAVPADMTAAELTQLRRDLRDLAYQTLLELENDARELEETDPTTAVCTPWRKGTPS